MKSTFVTLHWNGGTFRVDVRLVWQRAGSPGLRKVSTSGRAPPQGNRENRFFSRSTLTPLVRRTASVEITAKARPPESANGPCFPDLRVSLGHPMSSEE